MLFELPGWDPSWSPLPELSGAKVLQWVQSVPAILQHSHGHQYQHTATYPFWKLQVHWADAVQPVEKPLRLTHFSRLFTSMPKTILLWPEKQESRMPPVNQTRKDSTRQGVNWHTHTLTLYLRKFDMARAGHFNHICKMSISSPSFLQNGTASPWNDSPLFCSERGWRRWLLRWMSMNPVARRKGPTSAGLSMFCF